MNIIDLSYYIINYLHGDAPVSASITHLKLQKLLYYLKVWGLVADNDLVEGNFYHWDYGPVNTTVFKTFTDFDNKELKPSPLISNNPTEDEKFFINFILLSYGSFSAFQLSKMTHSEEPWEKTPQNAIISPELIKQYYSNKNFAKNFPINLDGPYYPVETNSHYSYIFDMDDSEQEEIYYNSFHEYLKSVSSTNEELDDFLEKFAKII